MKDLEGMDEVLQLDLVLAFGFVPASENICGTYSIYKSVHKIRFWRSSFAWYVIVFSLFFLLHMDKGDDHAINHLY